MREAPGGSHHGRPWRTAGIAYGCVPVIVHDPMHMTFDELLDWKSFAVFVRKVRGKKGMMD